MCARTLLACIILAVSPAYGLDDTELGNLLESARVDSKMPGLRAAVRAPDGRVVRAAVGLADKEAGIALDNDMGMPGGSTGKTFAAVLAVLLVEDGVLSLDDPAAKWLGQHDWHDRLPNADAIRVRHLLSHSSGMRDYPQSTRFNTSMVWRVIRHGSARYEPEELIGFVLNKKPLFAPGEGFHYTDAGYLALGLIIESATNRDYYELLAERVLEPLGLSQVRPQTQSALPNIATGYMGGARNLKKDGRMKFDPTSEWTGGGLVTTPTMLVEFFAALAEGRVVQNDSLQLMLNSGWRPSTVTETRYGFGVFVYDYGRSFGHGGLWPGYRTRVEHDLETGITIAVQTNRDGRVDLAELIDRISAAYSRH